jgi:hypothetical protein
VNFKGLLKVTQKHIDSGVQGDGHTCAVAVALKDMGFQMPRVGGLGASAMVGWLPVRIRFEPKVTAWINRFDSSSWRSFPQLGDKAPEPDEFEFLFQMSWGEIMAASRDPKGLEVLKQMCGSLVAAFLEAKRDAERNEDRLALANLRGNAERLGITAEVFGVVEEPDPTPEPTPPEPAPEPEPAPPTPDPVLVAV